MPLIEKSDANLAVSPPRSAESPFSSAWGGPSNSQAAIGRSLVIKGDLAGSESLYIDGRIEGTINLTGSRVTVGRNGEITGDIVAREIVVLGKVYGNCSASDRVDIRGEGSLTGDVIAPRISIEDGAYFKGGIDIRMPREANHRVVAVAGSALAASYDERAEESIAQGRYRTLEDESDIEGALPKWKPAQSKSALSKTVVEAH